MSGWWERAGTALWMLAPPLLRALWTQCKHQLAARLARLLKRCPVTQVPDAALAELLLQA